MQKPKCLKCGIELNGSYRKRWCEKHKHLAYKRKTMQDYEWFFDGIRKNNGVSTWGCSVSKNKSMYFYLKKNKMVPKDILILVSGLVGKGRLKK